MGADNLRNDSLIRMEGITKKFPGVVALKGANFELRAGETHVLFGENGAGKTTLIKVLSGVYPPTEGKIYINNEEVSIKNAYDARQRGISCCHQERSLVPQLTVLDNIFLGREFANKGILNKHLMRKYVVDRTEKEGLDIKDILDVEVSNLSIAKQQLVEIAKAVIYDASVIVLDEPSASLTDEEMAVLYNLIERLKRNGVGIIYISHRIDEIKKVCDRLTVLRDGHTITTLDSKQDITEDNLIRLITGYETGMSYPPLRKIEGKKILEVVNVATAGGLKNLNFDIREGEILGVGGLEGSGKDKVGRLLFGLEKIVSGHVKVFGEEIGKASPNRMLSKGIVYFPADKTKILFMGRPQLENQSILSLKSFTKTGFLQKKREKMEVTENVHKLSIVPKDTSKMVLYMSGGNQKKTLVSRGLLKKAKLIIFDEVTHGIDIHAKGEIYKLLHELSQNNVSIVMITSELDELLNISHRIITMHEHAIFNTFEHEEASRVKLLNSYFGIE
ncbi:MAG: sugar ABC transporter ATP-binding protein [Syntrophales bacterium]|jgi:ribose transport system ATP-binding protein|nr:sugar ABC transporter ATP-binding protein [Syntrophales bacterium]MCK9528683.1 sugar ABC transporter ATP-binding protein [Syntrophales bacterium]MDX9922636.1 sugar ABC transporter ATP-binding protein [Syntrophales bacterium]